MTLYTIGHGTRTVEEFVQALKVKGVQLLADVRSFPRSQTNPQFNSDALAQTLAASDIKYEHWGSLGGRRRGLGPNSPNSRWEHPAFRGYSDYMMEDAFWSALDALLDQASLATTAVMCSETLWWRCHRRMIADAAVARGARVLHIMKPGIELDHVLSPPGHIIGDRVSYAATDATTPIPGSHDFSEEVQGNGSDGA
jgi:hypothetical protein